MQVANVDPRNRVAFSQIQMADAARLSRQDLEVLFVTGFAENAAVGKGHLESGMEVITKPVMMTELANKITDVIESRRKAS